MSRKVYYYKTTKLVLWNLATGDNRRARTLLHRMIEKISKGSATKSSFDTEVQQKLLQGREHFSAGDLHDLYDLMYNVINYIRTSITSEVVMKKRLLQNEMCGSLNDLPFDTRWYISQYL